MLRTSLCLFTLFSLVLSLPGRTARADAVCAPWPDGTVCKPMNPCLGRGVCMGGNCVNALPLPAGIVCGTSTEPCRGNSTCDGLGHCAPGPLRPAGTVCGDSDNPCQGNRVCDTMGNCVSGSVLPPGTICRAAPGPCVTDSLCDAMGRCMPGPARPAGTICRDPESCRDAWACDGSGACLPGTPVNEGKPCIGSNACFENTCVRGTCTPSERPRDCSGGDPCLKKDSCRPDVGCVPVIICDMRMPDLRPPPDLLGADLAGADLSSRTDLRAGTDLAQIAQDLRMSLPDLPMSIEDLRTAGADLTATPADQQVPPPDQPASELGAADLAAAPDAQPDGPADGDMPEGPDGGKRPGVRGAQHALPFELAGGACQCRIGPATGPSPVLVVLLFLVLWARRRLAARPW
jgi:hypothetical protein